MNVVWPRILKSAYRREPITSFIITVGAVDAVIGGIGSRGSLLTFGLTVAGVAIALRWWQFQRSQVEETERVPELYLPASSSRPQLPQLAPAKKRRPQ